MTSTTRCRRRGTRRPRRIRRPDLTWCPVRFPSRSRSARPHRERWLRPPRRCPHRALYLQNRGPDSERYRQACPPTRPARDGHGRRRHGADVLRVAGHRQRPAQHGARQRQGSKTIYVQIPDTLALNVNSRVRVADVFVGTVRKIELKDWVPTLTLSVDPAVKLPTTRRPRSTSPASWAPSMSNWRLHPTRRRSPCVTGRRFRWTAVRHSRRWNAPPGQRGDRAARRWHPEPRGDPEQR